VLLAHERKVLLANSEMIAIFSRLSKLVNGIDPITGIIPLVGSRVLFICSIALSLDPLEFLFTVVIPFSISFVHADLIWSVGSFPRQILGVPFIVGSLADHLIPIICACGIEVLPLLMAVLCPLVQAHAVVSGFEFL